MNKRLKKKMRKKLESQPVSKPVEVIVDEPVVEVVEEKSLSYEEICNEISYWENKLPTFLDENSQMSDLEELFSLTQDLDFILNDSSLSWWKKEKIVRFWKKIDCIKKWIDVYQGLECNDASEFLERVQDEDFVEVCDSFGNKKRHFSVPLFFQKQSNQEPDEIIEDHEEEIIDSDYENEPVHLEEMNIKDTKTDYYTYQYFLKSRNFLRKENPSLHEVQKYSKSVQKIAKNYEKILGNDDPKETYSLLNSATVGSVLRVKPYLNELIMLDENGFVRTDAFQMLLENLKDVDMSVYERKNKSYHILLENANGIVERIAVIKRFDLSRFVTLKKNYFKEVRHRVYKWGLGLLGGAILFTGLGSLVKKTTPVVENNETIEQTYEDVTIPETIVEETESVPEIVETIEEEKEEEVEVEVQDNEEEMEVESSKEEYLEIKDELLRVQNVLMEREAIQNYEGPIGSYATISDQASIYGDIYSLANQIHAKKAYFSNENVRLVGEATLEKDGEIIRVTDNEQYISYVEQGYHLVGYGLYNEYSHTNDDLIMEGRYRAEDVTLKRIK